MLTERTREKLINASSTNATLPNSLSAWFEVPDHWSRTQESLELRNEWLSAERDDVVQYVKMLKKLAVYLAGKAEGSTNIHLGTFFKKSEENFPDYLCNEIAIGRLD